MGEVQARDAIAPGDKQSDGLPEHAVSVLLVDDQPIIGEAVRRMLAAQEDIKFRYCQDPTKAVEMASEVETTVILSDLVMPQLDGIRELDEVVVGAVGKGLGLGGSLLLR